ncbi:MAG: uroporphyrinogen-III synthase, partial [Alicyclobacillaceae bacterium]|nr:uroporphyrinogen-III synthase [Alicyclobacillaceae bacterium]
KWIVFTSRNAVDSVWSRLAAAGKDVRALHGVRVAAVGSSTAAALRDRGVLADLVAPEFRGSVLAEALKPHLSPGDPVLLPRSNLASRDLPDGLAKAGARILEVEAYRTVAGGEGADEVRSLLKEKRVHAVTFTSSSTARFFLEALGDGAPDLLSDIPIFCMGPVTEETARKMGLHVAGVAPRATVGDLVDVVVEHLNRRDGCGDMERNGG